MANCQNPTTILCPGKKSVSISLAHGTSSTTKILNIQSLVSQSSKLGDAGQNSYCTTASDQKISCSSLTQNGSDAICVQNTPSTTMVRNSQVNSMSFYHPTELFLAYPQSKKHKKTHSLSAHTKQLLTQFVQWSSTKNYDNTSDKRFLACVAFGICAAYHSSLCASPAHIIFVNDLVLNATYVANWKHINSSALCKYHEKMCVKMQPDALTIIQSVTTSLSLIVT